MNRKTIYYFAILALSVLCLSNLSCSKDDKEDDIKTLYPVSDSELTPKEKELFTLWGDSNDGFIQYYRIYTYFSQDKAYLNGWKSTYDDNLGTTVYSQSCFYEISNSILTVTYKEKSTKVQLKVQKAKERPLQNGDKLYLDDIPYTFKVSDYIR